jgi:hypothetical protein
MTAPGYACVVAIPARNEAELLPTCLAAIAAQSGIDPASVAVVVCANNCSDATAERARAIAGNFPFALHVEEVALLEPIAHAGGARRAAMDHAHALCAPGGMIVTTDADGRADPDWLAGYHAAFAADVALVAGRVSADWDELCRFPADVLDVGAREWDYQGLCAELEALCDPAAHDPWPNHNQTCGANIAITRAWYERIGGLPVLRTGEDGALFAQVWQRDGRCRHDLRPHVTVSARLDGRAQGGMADALLSRHGKAYLCDDLLEPAADLERRACWRRDARIAFHQGRLRDFLAGIGVDAQTIAAATACAHFGAAWRVLEQTWPRLAKRRVTAAALDGERAAARSAIARLRASPTTTPGDSR